LSGDQLEADLLGRLGCDLICLHGPMESEVLGELTRHNEHAGHPHVELGLWQLPPQSANENHDEETTRSVVFIEEQSFPASSVNRKKLISQLERLARVLPSWNILIQPDYGQPEDTMRRNPHNLSRLLLTKNLKPRPELPSNIILGAAGGLPRILANATVAATLTSSAALASVAWGKPLLVLADYGFSSSAQSQLWMGSGLTGRLAAITSGEELLELPAVHAGWLHTMGGSITDGAQRLLTSLQHLCEAKSA
jgi:hypothetical protein